MDKKIIAIITMLILIGVIFLLLSLRGKQPQANPPVKTPEPLPTSTAVAGPIAVTLDASSYSPSDTIVVTITNHSAKTINFHDKQTVCSVIRLERLVNQVWKADIGCKSLDNRMRLYTLAPGKSMKVKLPPPSGWPLPSNWPSGTYRAVLLYQTSNNGPSFTAISAVFQIR